MNLPHWWLRVAGWATSKRRRRTALFGSAERFEARTLLSSFVVNSPIDQPDADPGDGIAATASGETTLRAAIQEANAAPGPDTIILPPGLLNLSLSEPNDHSAAFGHLEITDELIIAGAGQEATFIDASQIDSAFHIQSGISLTLENLTLQIPADSGSAIVYDGGSLTLDEATIDEVPIESFPVIRPSDVTTNDRHATLLYGLYNPVVNGDEPLDPIFAPPPIFVSVVNSTRPDATIGIGSERSSGWMTADGEPDLQPAPHTNPAESSAASSRIAEKAPEGTGAPTDQRRREVVNSLFQNQPEVKQQTVKPVAGEQPEDAATEPRRLNEKFPMLLPMNGDGSLNVAPEQPIQGLPVPPPLPEPAELKNAAGHTRRAAGRSQTTHAIMAGVLLTMASPAAFRRAVKRLTGWKHLVV